MTRLSLNKKLTMPTSKQNTINEDLLFFEKQTVLFDMVREYARKFVKHKLSYPSNNSVEVELSSDFYILTKEEMNNLLKSKEENGKILDFKELKIRI